MWLVRLTPLSRIVLMYGSTLKWIIKLLPNTTLTFYILRSELVRQSVPPPWHFTLGPIYFAATNMNPHPASVISLLGLYLIWWISSCIWVSQGCELQHPCLPLSHKSLNIHFHTFTILLPYQLGICAWYNYHCMKGDRLETWGIAGKCVASHDDFLCEKR